jgi:two-component system chemotaxis response regulator CheB
MATGRRIRVLVVDDSAVMRSLLRSVFRTDSSIEVVGTAPDGESAIDLVESLRPDLVLLDVEMPVMDGVATLRKLRSRGHKMPIIMCSALTTRGARVTIEALASGASDYVAKPKSQAGPAEAIQALARDLLPKIAALTAIEHAAPAPVLSALAPRSPAAQAPAAAGRPQAITAVPALVVIGVSTGGPAALDIALPALPANFPLPVLIVQHMPELFTQLLAERLDQRCNLRVSEAKEGDPIRPGRISIARGNWHMEVVGARGVQPATLHLTQGPPENHCRPAAHVLFRTAVANYGAGTLAVVLTGMGADGLAGARLIRAQGGTVLAQDQPTSAVWGMPGAVAQAGMAQRILPLREIAPELIRLSSRTQPARVESNEAVTQ